MATTRRTVKIVPVKKEGGKGNKPEGQYTGTRGGQPDEVRPIVHYPNGPVRGEIR